MRDSPPTHWEISKLGDVFDDIGGGTPSKDDSEYWDGDIPWISSADIGEDHTISPTRFITEEGVSNSSTSVVSEGTLIIVTRVGLGKVGIAPCDLAFNQDCRALRYDESVVDPRFALYYFEHQESELKLKGRGTTVNGITVNELRSLPFALPPLREQQQIVGKIEEMFSKLGSGIKDLEVSKQRLNQFKRVVFQNAVEGKLTKNWRLNQEDIEPATRLLRRTKERREKECGGKYGKLIEPTDIPEKIEIPQNWAWASLSQIGEVSRGKSTHRPRNDASLFGGEYPFIQTGEVRAADTMLNTYEQTYNEKGLEQSRLWPEGTLCITIAANIGETAILGMDACFPDSVVGFLTNSEYCNVKYIEIYLRTIQRDLERYAPATAQKNINLGTLSDLPIPLPPIEEQDQVVQQVHSILSVVEDNVDTISTELNRADRLRQSILKQAFHGNLLTQLYDDDSRDPRPTLDSSEIESESYEQTTLTEVSSDVE